LSATKRHANPGSSAFTPTANRCILQRLCCVLQRLRVLAAALGYDLTGWPPGELAFHNAGLLRGAAVHQPSRFAWHLTCEPRQADSAGVAHPDALHIVTPELGFEGVRQAS
jgi:hypothetical protein